MHYATINVAVCIEIRTKALRAKRAPEEFSECQTLWCGPGSSVSTATVYELDFPGSNPGGYDIFRPFRLAQKPTQPPVQWVLGLSRGQRRPGRWAAPPHPHLECRGPRKSRTILLLILRALVIYEKSENLPKPGGT